LGSDEVADVREEEGGKEVELLDCKGQGKIGAKCTAEDLKFTDVVGKVEKETGQGRWLVASGSRLAGGTTGMQRERV
jgi:hypothetical protein